MFCYYVCKLVSNKDEIADEEIKVEWVVIFLTLKLQLSKNWISPELEKNLFGIMNHILFRFLINYMSQFIFKVQ